MTTPTKWEEQFDGKWKTLEAKRIAALELVGHQMTEFGSVLPTADAANENLSKQYAETRDDIKSFIHQLLSDYKSRLLSEVEGMEEKYSAIDGHKVVRVSDILALISKEN